MKLFAAVEDRAEMRKHPPRPNRYAFRINICSIHDRIHCFRMHPSSYLCIHVHEQKHTHHYYPLYYLICVFVSSDFYHSLYDTTAVLKLYCNFADDVEWNSCAQYRVRFNAFFDHEIYSL